MFLKLYTPDFAPGGEGESWDDFANRVGEERRKVAETSQGFLECREQTSSERTFAGETSALEKLDEFTDEFGAFENQYGDMGETEPLHAWNSLKGLGLFADLGLSCAGDISVGLVEAWVQGKM